MKKHFPVIIEQEGGATEERAHDKESQKEINELLFPAWLDDQFMWGIDPRHIEGDQGYSPEDDHHVFEEMPNDPERGYFDILQWYGHEYQP